MNYGFFRRATLALALTLGSAMAFAAEQIITPTQTTQSAGASQTVTITVEYTTANPMDETLTGLGFLLHFDSSQLTFVESSEVFSQDLIQIDSAPGADSDNNDSDASTDSVFNAAWASISGNWPGEGNEPASLYTVTFTTSASFSGTTVRFSANGTTASGYDFESTPVTINEIDTTAPVITLVGDASLSIVQGMAFTDPGVTATDNADGDISSNVAVTGTVDVNTLGEYTLTYNVSDAAGNAATAVTRTVLVTLGNAPVVTPPANATVNAASEDGIPSSDAAVQAFLNGASATDAEDGDIAVTNDAPAVLPIGSNVITFTATDSNGNVATAMATLAVNDGRPIVTPPAAASVEATGPTTPATLAAIATFLGGATATDDLDGMVAVTNDAPDAFPVGATTVTFSATDSDGATGTATAVLTITDTTAPTVTAPADATAEATSADGIPSADASLAAFLGGGSGTDLVDGDGLTAMAINLPTNFGLGANTVTFQVTDTAGNAGSATAMVTVSDTVGPVITVADGRAVAGVLTELPADNAMIQAFLTGGTAVDAVTGDATVTALNVPATFPLGDTEITFSATDGNGNESTTTATLNVLATAIPVITAPGDITVDATGPLTTVDTMSETATATDEEDGDLTVTVTGSTGPFPAGRSVILYSVTDSDGATAEVQQVITVNPLAQVGPAQLVAEGTQVLVDVMLSGDAPALPATVDFTVSGTATNPDDHNLVDGTVTISEGRVGSIMFDVATDEVADPDETVIITLTAATNAAIGPANVSTITITEDNIAPTLGIQVMQNGRVGSTVVAGDGNVTATALVSDPNGTEGTTYDWSASDTALVGVDGSMNADFVFDPSALDPGIYTLSVTVTDAGGASTSLSTFLRVLAALPEGGLDDSDGDGVLDADDPLSDPTQLPAANGARIDVQPGLTISLGQTAFAAGAGGGSLTLEQLAANGGVDGGMADVTDGSFTYPLPFFDFVIEGVTAGGTARIVITLPSGIPAGTVSYRKFVPGSGFQTFRGAANNQISSAAGVGGACPAPGSDQFAFGLAAGNRCIQLLLQDGGPNDADGMIDGRIEDPGTVGVATPPAPAPAPAPGGGSSGGGCSVVGEANAATDPTLVILALGAAAYLLRRRRTIQTSTAS